MFQAIIASIIGVFLVVGPVHAQYLNASYFDFETTASGTTLTVAMDPPQAFEVVRTSPDERWNASKIVERGDMLVAYVQDGITLQQNGSACAWSPQLDPVASSTLDVMANGITVSGPVRCFTVIDAIQVTSDLFTTRFPGHENIIRRTINGDYQELATLTATSSTAVVRISNPSQPPEPSNVSRAPSSPVYIGMLTLAVIGLLGTYVFRRRNSHRRSDDA
jgi:hypothetical protein